MPIPDGRGGELWVGLMDGDLQHGSWGSGQDLLIAEENFNQRAIYDFKCGDPVQRQQTLAKAIGELSGSNEKEGAPAG